MKKIILTLSLLLFILSCSLDETIDNICVSVYNFPNCVRNITIADNDPNLCDDIQIRLYEADSTYTLLENYYIVDSTFFLVIDEKFLYGQIYLIYYGI